MLKKTLDSYVELTSTSKTPRKLTKGEAFQKACNFCTYQDRTHEEVREKLKEFGLSDEDREELLTKLIIENFVNEERFAKAFCGGKFRMKKWGRNKIRKELKLRGLSQKCIDRGLLEINEEDYMEALKNLAIEKSASVRDFDQYKKRHKVSNFLIIKGYEPELVWEMIKKLV